MKWFFILLATIGSSNCYINTAFNKKQSITYYDKNKLINKSNRIFIPIKAVHNYCPSNLEAIFDPLKIEYGEKIVKSVTEFLPTADAIAPHVLHANEFMINILLNTDSIPMDIKKQLILNVIKISLFGDSVGSSMLHYYYDLVNCLL